MILNKLMKTLGVGGKILPASSSSTGSQSFSAFGTHGHNNNSNNGKSASFSTYTKQQPATKARRGSSSSSASSSSSVASSSSRTDSDLSSLMLSKTSSLPTIVEEENDQDAYNCSPHGQRMTRGSRPEDDSDVEDDENVSVVEEDDSHLVGEEPPRDLAKICQLLKGKNSDLDMVLMGFERVQEIVWSCLDTESESTIQFNALDPSTVPPPDIRDLESIALIETLLSALIRTKDFETKFKRSAACNQMCEEAIQLIRTHFPAKSSGKRFVLEALKRWRSNTEEDGVYDEEIIARLSSVIRFYLRLSLNSRKNFSPIVLSRQAKSQYDEAQRLSSGGDKSDFSHPADLNVAALLHRALGLLVESDASGRTVEAHEALRLRSAKKFIQNVLACAKRIEGVDEKRKRAWQAAQKWAGEVKRLFPDDLRDLSLLSDLQSLHRMAARDGGVVNDLALLESRREGLMSMSAKKGAGSAKELRAMRAQMTGTCGRNGLFPEVVFILDA